MRVLTPKQVTNIDQYIQALGLPVSHLMEQAGRSVFEVVQRHIREIEGPKNAVFLCGIGNNGGDALVAARLLAEVSMEPPIVVILGEPQKGSTLFKQQWKIISSLEDRIEIILLEEIIDTGEQLPEFVLTNAGIVVDGVFGTGFQGTLPEYVQTIFEQCKWWGLESSNRRCISIDIPSGVNGLTGEVDEYTFQADETVTLLAPKVGMLLYPGREYVGHMTIGSIGFPMAYDTLAKAMNKEPYIDVFWNTKDSLYITPRSPIAHKGINGHVYVVGGSPGIYGAPILSAEGALRSGAGKVTILSGTNELESLRTMSRPEMMINSIENVVTLDANSSVVIGPGGGRTEMYRNQLLQRFEVTHDSHIVIDADGLIAIASDLELLKKQTSILSKTGHSIVLTPHKGEFSILTGKSIEEIDADPIGIVHTFATSYGVYVVLKGQPTLIGTPTGVVGLTTSGNPYMGTGGMGDVLAGVIGSMLNQTDEVHTAIKLAVYAHSVAGDRTLAEVGPGFTPSEVALRMGQVIREIRGYSEPKPL